jgi:hypothetical protein
MHGFVLNAPVLWWQYLLIVFAVGQLFPWGLKTAVRKLIESELAGKAHELQKMRQTMALVRLAHKQAKEEPPIVSQR